MSQYEDDFSENPHSKALPACRQAGNPTASLPPLAIMTQSPTGEELIFSLNCVNIMMLYCAGDPAPAAFGGIRHLSVKYLMRFSLKIGN